MTNLTLLSYGIGIPTLGEPLETNIKEKVNFRYKFN